MRHKWTEEEVAAIARRFSLYVREHIGPEDMDNPIGTRNGHLYAWKKIKALRQLRGVIA